MVGGVGDPGGGCPRRIHVLDTTLRDGEQCPGAAMSPSQKETLALVLEDLGVDAIEAGFPVSSPSQLEGVRRVARRVRTCTVSALARCLQGDVDQALLALGQAKNPMIHVFLATSPLHRRHKLRLDQEAILERVRAMVSYAAARCPLVAFSPEDATRTEPAYLDEVVRVAVAAGAGVINIPDTVGVTLPGYWGPLVRHLKEKVLPPQVRLSVHCHNDLGLAAANSLEALQAGADQVEVTLAGLGERAGNCALEEVAMALRLHGAALGLDTSIRTDGLYPAARLLTGQIGWMLARNKAVLGENAYNHQSGIHQHGVLKCPQTYEILDPSLVGFPRRCLNLGRHSGRHALRDRLEGLGVRLDEAGLDRFYQRFLEAADRRSEVGDDALLALLEEDHPEVERGLTLEYLHVVTGNALIPGATVRLSDREGDRTGTAHGAGPVEALLAAIDQALGLHPQVLSYQVVAVGTGTDAPGRVCMDLELGGKKERGEGVDTDILRATALAFLEALNRLRRQGVGLEDPEEMNVELNA